MEEITNMNLAELSAVMESTKAELADLCSKSLGAFTNPSAEPSYAAIVNRCATLCEVFNNASVKSVFIKAIDSEDPMVFMVKDGFTVLNASVKSKHKDFGGGEVRWLELDVSEKQTDLLKFAAFCKDNGVDLKTRGDWINTIQQLGLRLTLKAAAAIGITGDALKALDDSFNMTKLAREVQLAKADESGSTPDPVSKAQLIKTLDLILALMIGDEFHCDSRDVAFLTGTYTRKGRKALTLKTSNNRELTSIIHQCAHRVALGKAYSIDAYTKRG